MVALFFLFLSLLSLADSSGYNAKATGKPGLFIFGDSTVDAGTNSFINTTEPFRANYFPYGSNGYFKKPTGRFSNGRLSPDFIAEFAKLPLIPPFLQPGADLSYGANFASGGAGILSATHQGRVVDFITQIEQFRGFKQNITKLGSRDAQTWFQNSVYSFSIGNNDFGAYIGSEARDKMTLEEFKQLLVEEFTSALQVLYHEGARKFVVASLVDLGCLPSVRLFANGSCLDLATNFAAAYNLAMEQSLVKLSSAINITYVWFDLAGFLRTRMNNPQKYGLSEPIDACCGSGPLHGLDTCGKAGKNYTLCSDPGSHVWFDCYHSTETIHKQIAETLWEGNDSTVRPTSVRSLFNG